MFYFVISGDPFLMMGGEKHDEFLRLPWMKNGGLRFEMVEGGMKSLFIDNVFLSTIKN